MVAWKLRKQMWRADAWKSVRIARGHLQRELETVKAEVARLYARWQELDEISKGGK